MHRNVTFPPRRQLCFARVPKIRHAGIIPEITCREIVARETSSSLEIIRRVEGGSLARTSGLELSILAVVATTFDIIHGIVCTVGLCLSSVIATDRQNCWR